MAIPVIILAAAVPAACGRTSDKASSVDIEARDRFRSGMELARQELHEGAAAELRRYLEIVPDDAEARFQLARSLLQIARRHGMSTAPAIEELRRALALSPRSTPIALQLAEALAEEPDGARRDEILRLYEEVIHRERDNYEARLLCARWLLSLGGPENRDRAMVLLEEAADAPEPWRGRAQEMIHGGAQIAP